MKTSLLSQRLFRKASVCIAAAGLLLGATTAHALVFNFTADHATGGLGQGAGPYGTVTLLQNGPNVDFTVHLLNGNQFVKTGAGDFMNFKFNATGIVLADITIDAHAPALTAAGPGIFSGNGTGNFAWGITNAGGNGGGGQFAPDIVFHVANSVLADFTAANNLGFVFAADVISGTNGNTGPIATRGPNTDTPGVPDGGATVLLLGGTLAALALVRRFLKV